MTIFVSIKRTNDYQVNAKLSMDIRTLVEEYNGTEVGYCVISNDIDDAAIKLFEYCESVNLKNIIFDCPVVLKSKDDKSERGSDDLYIWQLKKKFFQILTLKGYEHTFKCADSIGEAYKSVNNLVFDESTRESKLN